LGRSLIITVVAHIFGLLLSTVKVTYALILTKNELGYILGDFSKTHLVTLVEVSRGQILISPPRGDLRL
jgi:hypothetical protein